MDLYDKLDRAVTKAFQPNALDKIIVGIAQPIDIERLKGVYLKEVTDKIYREQTSLPKKFYWEIFIISATALSLLLYKIFLDFDSILIRIISIIVYIAICIGLGGIAFILPYRELILDREAGTISLHKPFKKDNIIIPFNRGIGWWKMTGTKSNFAFELWFSFKGRAGQGGVLASVYIEEFWDFVVWYMDKNRPLPPGTAFDPYREADFQRRKAEGFPKPLYGSIIETPEATPEQQAERERIGGW